MLTAGGSDEHAAEVLSRAVREHVALLNNSELVALVDRLHDEAGLEERRFAVVRVSGKGRDNTLCLDVTSLVHEPPWSYWSEKYQ